jgi:hypothetical protein
MKIELLQDHAVAIKVLPQGTQLRVSNKLGKELIDLEIAKGFDGYTKEEQVEHILEIAADNEETPIVKKITKRKKQSN